MKNGQTMYDAMAPYYREYCTKKEQYLSAVDDFVVSHTPCHANTLLDVGAGDGVRGMTLSKRLGCKHVILAEPSIEMFSRCRLQNPSEAWYVDATHLPFDKGQFDVVVCLWNVLGHIPDSTQRIEALKKMAMLLTNQGMLFVDVNNRYNAPAYGFANVAWRILLDFMFPDETRGDANFEINLGGQTIPAMGHLFTHGEMKWLFSQTGLTIKHLKSINYSTGAQSTLRFMGQLVYAVKKEAN